VLAFGDLLIGQGEGCTIMEMKCVCVCVLAAENENATDVRLEHWCNKLVLSQKLLTSLEAKLWYLTADRSLCLQWTELTTCTTVGCTVSIFRS
jgi:hypothetical protein